MARSKTPIAAKDLKTYPVDEYPYLLTKPNQMPSEARYFRSFREARAAMVKDLESIRYSLVTRLNQSDAVPAIAEVKAQVDRLTDEGGAVSGVVDPYTGVKYRATLTRRTE